jgi:cytoskeleton protein RodZ
LQNNPEQPAPGLLYYVWKTFLAYFKERSRSVSVSSIGEELRRDRLRQGLSLDEIAQRTRISLRSLESIETDDFDRLPGVVFTRNFVRLYALDLKLDPDALLARLPRVDIETAPLPNPPARSGRSPWDPRLTAARVSVLWLVTASGAGMGAWYYWNHYARHSTSTVSSAPAPKAQPVVQTAIQTASQSPARQSNSTHQSIPVNFDSNRPVQVILTAHEATWVQVSADGQTAFVGMLHPNDTRSISADDQVKIIAGNAGGLDISLNGKPLDPIGPTGQVRTVRLTAEGPQYGQKNPPVSSPL